MVYGGGPWHGADIEEDTDIGLEDGTKRVEEPAVRVDLLLVFLFETEELVRHPFRGYRF